MDVLPILDFASFLLHRHHGVADGDIAILLLAAALFMIAILLGMLAYLMRPIKPHPLNPFKGDY